MNKIINNLNSFLDLEKGWGYEDAVKPNPDLIKKVILFVKHLEKNNYLEPEVNLFPSGYISLSWKNKKNCFFAEIDFYEDDVNGCYIHLKNKDEEKIYLSEDFKININELDSKNLNILFSFIKKDNYV